MSCFIFAIEIQLFSFSVDLQLFSFCQRFLFDFQRRALVICLQWGCMHLVGQPSFADFQVYLFSIRFCASLALKILETTLIKVIQPSLILYCLELLCIFTITHHFHSLLSLLNFGSSLSLSYHFSLFLFTTVLFRYFFLYFCSLSLVFMVNIV